MRLHVSRDDRFILIILVPIVILIAVFIYYPAFDTLRTSMTSRNLRLVGQGETFTFLDNYGKLLSDKEFWQVTGRSFLLVAVVLPLEITIGFLVALLLNEKFPGRGIVRTLVILPWMLPPVVNGFLWGWLLNGEYGALNGFLYQLGLIQDYQFWLRQPQSQILWVGVVQTWTRFAFPMIIMLAGLQSIPDDLYAAAKVDGANVWNRLWTITFPLLLPSFAIALIVEFVASFQIFDIAWTLTAGGSAGTTINPFTKTLMIYNYQIVFRDLRIGLGSALAYLILVMSLVVGLIFVRRIYNQGVRE
jgi:multiple sugar transport system permease protein